MAATPASASERDDSAPPADAARAADAGLFLPSPVAPRLNGSVALVSATWNSLSAEPTMTAAAQANVWGPLTLRLGAAARAGEARPIIAAGVAVLEQGRDGIDAGVWLEYDGIGHEGEPQMVLGLSAARRFDATALFVNLVYGHEIDEDQRHGELRAAVLHTFAPAFRAGLDGRIAIDLDAGRESTAIRDVDLTFVAGPMVVWTMGRFAAVAQLGTAGLRFKHEPLELGVAATGGIGAAF